MDVLDGAGKKAVQWLIWEGCAGRLRAIRAGHHLHLAQHHVRAVNEVAVHLNAVIIGGKMHPFGFNVYHAVALLEEQNIRNDFRPCRSFERIVGQANGPQQFRPLCNVLSHIGGTLIHGEAGGHKGDDAARTDFIQRLCNEILMDRQVQPVIPFVCHLELAERHIADGHIKEIIGESDFLIALYRNAGALIELASHAAGEVIQFHAIQLAVRHALRQHTEEIAHAAGRFQDVALLETHLLQRGVNAADDHGRRVERRQGGLAGSGVLGVGQQFLQLTVPGVFLIEEIRQAAPAHILRQHRLFLCRGGAVLRFHGFQQTDGIQVALKPLQRRAFSDMVIGDAVIAAGSVQRVCQSGVCFLSRWSEGRASIQRWLWFLGSQYLHLNIKRQLGFLSRIVFYRF